MEISREKPSQLITEKVVIKTDINLVNQLLNDIVLYNDVENIFSNAPNWGKERKMIKGLECDARVLLEKSIMVSDYNQKIRVAVVGNFSAGKSTFINSLIQYDICPIADKPTTSSVTTFTFAINKAFYVIDDVGNKKEISAHDYKKMVQHGTEKTASCGAAHFFVEGPWSFVRDISLLDTPGFQKGDDVFTGKNGGDDAVTEAVIKKEADVLFWLMDINTGTITKDQKERIEKLKRETNDSVEIYVVLNKADTKGAISRENIMNGIKSEIGHLINGVILFSSIAKKQKETTLHEVIKQVKTSVENQSLSYQKTWELKLSSSLGQKGGLKFHFHDNGSELCFLHKAVDNNGTGKISERHEVQEILNEIGSNNKEILNKSFNRELAAYYKRKENLIHISNKVKKRMDELWDSIFKPKFHLFIEEQEAISKFFVKNNIGVFCYMNVEKDLNEIVNYFMKLYSSTFDVFRKKIEEKTNYSLYEKELVDYDIRELFKNCLIAFKDIEVAMSQTTYFFNQNLYSTFYAHNQLEYRHLSMKYNNIYKKLP